MFGGVGLRDYGFFGVVWGLGLGVQMPDQEHKA